MIIGIGTDIIEVERVARAISKEAFKKKVFSEREIAYCESQKKEESFAARFAAKEAFFKALGTGWRDGMGITEVEILNDDLGKPSIHLSGKAKEVFEQKGGTHIHLSLSHIKTQAAAFVILEQQKP
jgi:holo-[acyl-carrier protein] synthase